MQFKVPQFLEIEDKIFGPFTFKEFIYLAGGAGLCFILYRLLGFWLGAIPIFLVASFSIALTFYRPNDKPFLNMLESVFRYSFQNKLYIWKRKKHQTSDKKAPVSSTEAVYQGSRLSQSKLRDLAWSLDVLDLSRQRKDKQETG